MIEVLALLSGAGRDLISWCVSANLKALLILGGALAADQLLARRLSPAFRIVLYAAVFVAALVPNGATWTVPFWESPAPSSYTIIEDDAAMDVAAATAVHLAAMTRPPIWPIAALGLYVAGVAALLAAWTRDQRTLRGVLHASYPSPQDSTVLVSRALGPMVTGVRRPRIVIPQWLVASETLPLILAHERAHIVRRDPALAFLLRVYCTFAWPVVPLWIAAARVRALMEHACDDHALSAPGARRQENTMKYAQAMIEVAQRSTYVAGTLAFGAALRSRIKALRPTRRWPAAIQIGVACLAPIFLLACSAARPGVARTATADKAVAAQDGDEVRVAIVSVIRGEAPVSALELGNGTSLGIVATDRRELIDNFALNPNNTILAQPRLKLFVGQPAAILTKGDGLDLSIHVLVNRSEPEVVNATLSFAEGDAYQMPPTPVQFKRGQACVLSIPPTTPGREPRVLIVTIDRPGEESNVGC